jgi:serine protease
MFRSAGGTFKMGTSPPPRAIIAVMALPTSAPPPPTSASVIEFYNAGLDHYFITAIPQEISDLDTGVHAGWARTGQSFNAYGVGSSGPTTRRPVCREYGLPSQGLNTHFYSASADECFATLSNLGAWGLEASEVFDMDLPDAVTGACPPGGVPVYRIWNQRYDSNHRYTTSTAIRDQMVAKGGIAEGYGPNAVALCGLP